MCVYKQNIKIMGLMNFGPCNFCCHVVLAFYKQLSKI